MLVLTRKLQQQIKIGDQITVTILRVKGHTVRVGIEAPRDVRVVRGELPPLEEGQAADSPDATVIEAVVTITDDQAQATESADEAAAPRVTNPASKPRGSSLNPPIPPRRVLSRMGGAPLRQIMANATLAK